MAKLWSTDGASALEEKSYRVIKIESQEQAKKGSAAGSRIYTCQF